MEKAALLYEYIQGKTRIWYSTKAPFALPRSRANLTYRGKREIKKSIIVIVGVLP